MIEYKKKGGNARDVATRHRVHGDTRLISSGVWRQSPGARYGLRRVSPDSLSSIVPTRGTYTLSNSSGLLIVRMAAKARMRVCGKTSANRFAAPRRVAPRVITSSTNKISSGLERRPWTLSDS